MPDNDALRAVLNIRWDLALSTQATSMVTEGKWAVCGLKILTLGDTRLLNGAVKTQHLAVWLAQLVCNE